MGKGKYIKAVGCCVLFLGLAYYTENTGSLLNEEGTLKRNPFGQGDWEAHLVLNAEGIEDYPYEINVKEIRITEAEAREYFKQAKKEIDQTCTKESLEHITENIVTKSHYVDGLVAARWSFSGTGAVDIDGKILPEKIAQEGELAEAGVTLSCGDYQEVYEFSFQVFSRKKSKTEQILAKINENFKQQTDDFGNEELTLPSEMDGVRLTWSEPKQHLTVKVLIFEIIILILLKVVELEQRKEKQKQRRQSMQLDYPDIVSKMAILMGAGMSVTQAWNIICARYMQEREKRLRKIQPAYEEMVVTSYEIQDGVSERTAFQKFGERTGVGEYHRFSRILVQSMQKGNKGICQMLEQESEDSFENRRLIAKKLGEEASTKMLVPLMMMMGIVMAVIMVPALLNL